jgi:hypothetical protein
MTYEQNRYIHRKTRLEKCLIKNIRFWVRIHGFLRYFRIGLANHYPVCCVSQFAWEASEPVRSQPYQAVKRGGIFEPDGRIYVPCSLHIRRHPNWRAWDENDHRYQLRLFTMEPKR